jgi:hypothetical protein
MADQMIVKIRSRDGSPIRLDILAKQVEQAGCEIVSIPTSGRSRLRTLKHQKRQSTAPEFGFKVV